MKNITKYAATALIAGMLLVSGSAHAAISASPGQTGNPGICEALQSRFDAMLEQFYLYTGFDEAGMGLGPEGAALKKQLGADGYSNFVNHMHSAISTFYFSAYTVYGCSLELNGFEIEGWNGPQPYRPN